MKKTAKPSACVKEHRFHLHSWKPAQWMGIGLNPFI
jgi:hypothetical protein